MEDVFTGILHCSAEFRDYLQAQEPVYFSSQIDFFHTNGTPYTNFRSEMVLHCLQHSTFHRGQIITMARGLDLTEVPNTDFMRYVRSKS